ncbi:hypothetical protein BDR07DRAFT_1480460 [Suillus spraguei]|nr:hypothetical protein BDR07DRAFT_1480460 [Suillus spraguei]
MLDSTNNVREEDIDVSGDIDPCVVPIQAHGVIDAEATLLSNQDVLANALVNMSSAESYVVQHGSGFVNEYAHQDGTGMLYAVQVNVVGTDKLRISIRTYIWGMTILRNPPSLWVTINPTDTHDPIVQVFAGEEIDLDLFDCTAGPDSAQHAKIVADDPYTAAKFFHFIQEEAKLSSMKEFLALWRGILVLLRLKAKEHCTSIPLYGYEALLVLCE